MSQVNSLVWTIATFLLIGCGLYYTFKLNFIQFSFKKMINSIKKDRGSNGISPFKTLTLALAARIGVGSLAGIAIGIYNGGIGVVFWLWLSSFITLPNSFVESTLAVIFRKKDGNFYQGGPSFYISSGLNNHKMAIIYSVIVCFCYLGCFLSIQSNTISRSLYEFLDFPLFLSGIIISIISYIIISKGISRIANFNSFLVPIMGIIYMMVSLVIIIMNIKVFPQVILTIIKEAFNIKAFGWGIMGSIIIGVQRGIFSSESGIGTGAIASGTSNVNNPLKQGYTQMLGVYFTSFIICTGTAFIIITSNIDVSLFSNPNGIEITLSALNYHLGNFGTIILLISIIAFAFSTIISGYYYGESSLKFIDKNMNTIKRLFLNIVVVLVLLYGSIATPSFLWNLADIGVGIMAIINTYAMIKLRKVLIKKYKERSSYDR